MQTSTKTRVLAASLSRYAALLADFVCESPAIPLPRDTSCRADISGQSGFDPGVDPAKQAYALDHHNLAFVIELDHSFFSRRLLNLILLPFHNRRLNKRLRQMGAVSVRRYGVWPTLQNPTFIFELNTSAELYAHHYLMGKEKSFAARMINFFSRLWAGCNPGIAAIVFVGKLP